MQIFPKKMNLLALVLGVVSIGALSTVVGVFWYYFSPKNLQVGYTPKQPVAYSHRLHVGELGLDCRYCHTSVESSQEAAVPPTQTCMGCHAVVKTKSNKLEKVRQSWASGKAIEWVRVHKLPEHAYFDHSVHVAAGVGCVSCHGRIDQAEEVGVVKPLSMGWCLDCHRDPAPHIRPRDEVTNMEWERPQGQPVANVSHLNPPQHCSGCHR